MKSEFSATEPSGVGFLRVAALVLFGIFLGAVVLRSLPIHLLDPVWQVSFATSLVDMGGYPLLGVVVLTLTHLLRPNHRALVRQLLGVSRLCRFAALGYLLLVPLVISALIRDFQNVEQMGRQKREALTQEQARLKQSLKTATTQAELFRTIQIFNAPAVPKFAAANAPLETQRQQALDLLESTTRNVLRTTGNLPAGTWNSILLNNLRILFLCLLLAFGFSSAYSGSPSFPILDLILPLLLILPFPWFSRRNKETKVNQENDFYESLSKSDEDKEV